MPIFDEIQQDKGFLALDPQAQRRALSIAMDRDMQSSPAYKTADQVKLEQLKESFLDDYLRPEPTAIDTVKDVGRAFAVGAQSIPRVAGQVADFAGAEKTAETLKNVAATGETFWKQDIHPENLKAMQSDILQSDTPLKTVLFSAFQSLPGMVAMAPGGALIAGGLKAAGAGGKVAYSLIKSGVSGRIARRLGHLAASSLGYGSAEGIYSGLENAAQAGEEVKKMPLAELLKSPAFQDLLEEFAGDEVAARRELSELAEANTFVRTAPVTGALGVATGGGVLGKISRKLAGSVIKLGFEGARSEAIQELFQSGAEKYIENTVTRDLVNPEVDTLQGVAGAALTGAATGALTGATGGAISAGRKQSGTLLEVSGDKLPPPVQTERSGDLLSNLRLALSEGQLTPDEVRDSRDDLIAQGIPAEGVDSVLQEHLRGAIFQAETAEGAIAAAAKSVSALAGVPLQAPQESVDSSRYKGQGVPFWQAPGGRGAECR